VFFVVVVVVFLRLSNASLLGDACPIKEKQVGFVREILIRDLA